MKRPPIWLIVGLAILGPLLAAWSFFHAQARRLAEVDKDSTEAVERERYYPAVRRPPLRGPARDGDVLTALDRALASVATPASADWAAINTCFTRPIMRGQLPRPFPPALEPLRARSAASVAAVRSALSCDRIESSSDIDAELESGSKFLPGSTLRQMKMALAIEAWRELDRDPEDACRVALDGERLRQDVARRRRLFDTLMLPSSTGKADALVIADALPRLDDGALGRVASELDALESTEPSYAEIARREKTMIDRWLLAMRDGRTTTYSSSWIELPVWYRTPLLRDVFFARDLDREREVYALAQEPPTPAMRAELARLAPALNRFGLEYIPNWFESHLQDLARLTVLRAVVAAERFRRARGRWPASVDELGVDATDPFVGKPLRMAATNTGIKIWSVGHDDQDDGGAMSTSSWYDLDVTLPLEGR